MRALLLAVIACRSPDAPRVAEHFEKGQLHVHSNHSGDSATPPEDVAAWYRERDYDFIVMTDHNVITSVDGGAMIVAPGVELTQNLETCDPPPAPGMNCLLHVNALFVTPPAERRLAWSPVSTRRLDLYLDALAATTRMGGIAQLNHPNFHWAADAALIGELARHGLALFEVANQSSDVANDGDATHPSTEQLWDTVLATGARLYGTATDDAHAYADADAIRAHGGTPDTGDHGWVMVRAPHDAQAIRDALARGDFYATTGVTLRRIERVGDTLEIDADTEVSFACIGAGTKVLSSTNGRSARCVIPRGSYVRAVVTDARGRRAWVQPAW
jgi:hypothetical protein